MAKLYETPALTVRYIHHRDELCDASAPARADVFEVLSFCLDEVREHFELPQGAKCIRFEVWEGKGPDRVVVTHAHDNEFMVDDKPRHIKTAARRVLLALFKRCETLHVALTYE